MSKNTKRAVLSAIALLLGANIAWAGAPEDWKSFAASTKDPRHEKWADMISAPQAKQLAASWKAFRGYDAQSLMAGAKLPPELKPGLVITKDNIDSMPWLAKYMPAATMARIRDGKWFSWPEVRIVPTSNYYMSEGVLEATRRYQAAGRGFTINNKGELLTDKGQFALTSEAAMPFTAPKTGLELAWQFMAFGVGSDNMSFKPAVFNVCDSQNALERSYTAHVWWQKMHGRTSSEPKPDVPGREGVVEAGAIFFLAPYDVKGMAVTRQRFAEADRADDFRAFLASLRRTRILAGSDAQDPMGAGLETTWEEWRQSWSKPDPRSFEYSIAGEGFVLAQAKVGHAYDPLTSGVNTCAVKSIDLELRPVWILEVKDKTGSYIYSKRRLYIDKELYYAVYQEMYDQRGNLWRVLDDALDWDPSSGLTMWRNYVIWNAISRRWNHIDIHSDWSVRNQNISSQFDIDRLRDYR